VVSYNRLSALPGLSDRRAEAGGVMGRISKQDIACKQILEIVPQGIFLADAGNFISRSEDLSPRAVDAILNIVAHGTAYVTLGCGRRWLERQSGAVVLTIATTYGEVVTIDAGEWLQGAGQFNFLSALTADEWEAMRPAKKPSR